MEPEKTPETTTPPPPPEGPKEEEKPPYRPYSKKTRLLAWLGVAFMVVLVILYTYSFASGSILWW